MATEKRLIDANELVQKMRTEDILHPMVPWSTSAVEVLCKRLALDAVEVVRCADCKCWCEDTLSCTMGNHYDDNWYAEDFCSYGERK